MSEPFTFSILFVRHAGWHSPIGPGYLSLMISYGAIRLDKFRDDGMALEESEEGTKVRRVALSEADAAALLAAVRATGLPDRSPRVGGNMDTSDVWSRNLLEVDVMGKRGRLELDLLASGYDGADGEVVAALFRKLLTAAGVKSETLWRDLGKPKPR